MHTRMHACTQWPGSVTRRTLGLKPPSMAQSHTRCAAFASATVHCDAQSAVASGARAAAAAASAPAATPSATCPQVYLSHCTSAAQPAVLAELSGEKSAPCVLRGAALGCRQGHEQDHQKSSIVMFPTHLSDVPALRPKPLRCNGSRKAGAGWRPGSRAHGRQSCARGKYCGSCLAAAGPRRACLFCMHWSQPALATDARSR